MTGWNKKTTLTPDNFPDVKNVGKSVLIQTSGARECETLWGRFEEQMVVHMSGRWRPGAEVEQKHCQKIKTTQHRHRAAPAGTACLALNAAWVLFRGAKTCEGLLYVHLPRIDSMRHIYMLRFKMMVQSVILSSLYMVAFIKCLLRWINANLWHHRGS